MQASIFRILKLITCRSFSDGEAVDSVETQKTRIVLREMEDGWWILAVCIAHVRSKPQLTPR
jgi:hypothetical protein